ncbi:choice-of-anchor M domain-containing protein [Agromyces aerolatus]|uniref:choice-of-anchor M domain-containing protein n=1 Tax=Agromyces sp. LY-1074 TaxID=3074080 RepID=UPI002856F728|nr:MULTISPECIES: choice-of-anchor M domain-containing protein [unclassified Agromyces]MDR5700865.1 choice-of-anchor M domain-containing protein [Agromyces sp. LY-1074]MDR5707474.1 choice-of-anchor M domain-containing protein [Agromyces sp. LY-1358]
MSWAVRRRVATGAVLALVAGVFGVPGSAVGTPAQSAQSDQPAPPSISKQVVGAVHTDTVSAYLDSGSLVLASRADLDVDGDGVAEVGTRLDPADVLFHLAEHGRAAVPESADYRFLGASGAPIWLAPQIQDHSLIWPGFSTEDPALSGQVDQRQLSVRMLSATGPGEVEIFLQDGGNVRRVFSSTADLPGWQTGVPQHTHMNWAFTQAGTYELEFEMSGVVAGRQQSASNRYTFVVGDLAAHTRATTTELTGDRSAAAAGEPITFTAEVSPAVAGAVQYRDLTANAVLGHAPVDQGIATFRADALAPGPHRIQAEFVPTYADDATPSTSAPLDVTVSGVVQPRPGFDDTEPVPGDRLDPALAGTTVAVTTPQKRIVAGATLTAKSAEAHGGKWVSAWLHAPGPDWYGWVQTDLAGAFSIDLPADAKAGDASLVLKDLDGALIGWDRFTVVAADGGSGGGTPPPAEPPVDPNPAPVPPVQAAPQECAPSLVLDRGHIDLFFVSAADGKAVLQLVEDVTGLRVVHEAETVLLRVAEHAYRTDIPPGTPGAPAGYVLPLTQAPDLIWPGWDTNRTAAGGHSDVTIHVTAVDGPGRVHLYSQGSFGDIRPLLQGGATSLPGSIREPAPAHTHAQWVFSEPGIYQLTAHATATHPQTGATLTTAAHTYVFQVGDVPLGDVFCRMTTRGVADAAAVNAAVDRAAAEAIAADQAANPELGAEPSRKARTRVTVDAADDGERRAGTTGQPVLAAIVGGGVLVILGLAGGTWWTLRRLREPAGVQPDRQS